MEPLPNELLDCVIENLYSDIPSLLSCALVGRAWVRSSQRGIFRDIVLKLPSLLHHHASAASMDAHLDTTRKLAASFSSTPRLASYVRVLELKQIFNPNGNLVELHIATANVIQQLSSLYHLKFWEIRWTELSPILRAALAGLLRTPSLTEFTFLGSFGTSLAEVTLLLNQMPRQLKALRLSSIYLYIDEETEHNDLPSKSIQLETLILSDCHTNFLMDWFRKDTCPFEIRNLQSLHITVPADITEYEGRDMDRYLHYVGRSLTELELDISAACNNCLTYTPNLRILHLRGITLTSSSALFSMICPIFDPLFHPDGNKISLRRLKMDLILNAISHLSTQLDGWTKIDQLLDRSELSELERVDVFIIRRTRLNSSEADVFGNLLRGKLQNLEASGKLYIHHRLW